MSVAHCLLPGSVLAALVPSRATRPRPVIIMSKNTKICSEPKCVWIDRYFSLQYDGLYVHGVRARDSIDFISRE